MGGYKHTIMSSPRQHKKTYLDDHQRRCLNMSIFERMLPLYLYKHRQSIVNGHGRRLKACQCLKECIKLQHVQTSAAEV